MFVIMAAWIFGTICALYCVITCAPDSFKEISGYVDLQFENKLSIFDIIKNNIINILVFTVTIYIASTHIAFIPITIAVSFFHGFSEALTTSFLIRIFMWKGMIIVILSVILPLVLSTGAYFAMLICALRYPLLKMENRRRNIVTPKKAFISNSVTVITLFLYLCLVSIIQSVLASLIYYII